MEAAAVAILRGGLLWSGAGNHLVEPWGACLWEKGSLGPHPCLSDPDGLSSSGQGAVA